MHILVLQGQHLVVDEDTAAGSQPVGNGDCPGGVSTGNGLHTDLVETALVREDGNVSVVACASYMVATAVSIYVALVGSLLRTRHDEGGGGWWIWFIFVVFVFSFSSRSRSRKYAVC